MRTDVTIVLSLTMTLLGCTTTPPPVSVGGDWRATALSVSARPPAVSGAGAARERPPFGKFSLGFYQKLRARGEVAPLAAVDVWELRHHPRQYDIITVGPVSITEWSGRSELLDQLELTHGLTKDKAAVLVNWVKAGGVVWVEFGVVVQGHEWIRNAERRMPAPPVLSGFTIFGYRTHGLTYEAKQRRWFEVEPAVFSIRNEARHAATADVTHLKLLQADAATAYAVIDGDQGEVLVRDGERVYATVVPLGRGRIVSTLPFDRWDAESDGEKYRINLVEWLGGFPVPAFDPMLDVHTEAE